MELKNDRFDISVIIPTYNRSRLLEYSLQSLLLQETGDYSFEVIVTDDGSSDDTFELVGKYKSQLNVKYLYQEDRGYRVASARNKAIAVAEGKLCVFIDSGVLLNSDCLVKHILFHENNGPDVAVVGYVYGFDREGEAEKNLFAMIDPSNVSASIREISKHPVYYDVREKHFNNHNDIIHDLPAPWLYFWTGHVSVSRGNLLKAGLFDEAYDGRWGVEDNDLGFRLNQAGVKIHLLRAANCIHYPHNNPRPEKVVQGKINCTYFHNKFNTIETGMFLETFGKEEFIDINLLCLQSMLK